VGLFDLNADHGNCHPDFEQFRTDPLREPARRVLDELYGQFIDNDGNFLEQFQTTGFHARLFELCLFGYFLDEGYTIDRSSAVPDFLVAKDGVTIAIGATTANAPQGGVLATAGKRIEDVTEEDLDYFQLHELPMRFGSPLISKLKKRYWERPRCHGLPFVLAIAATFEERAKGLTSAGLNHYLYGSQLFSEFNRNLVMNYTEQVPIETHEVGTKTVPSGFFAQPDSEHVSAVLFLPSDLVDRLSRIAHQTAHRSTEISIRRQGFCSNITMGSRDPTFFAYDLDNGPIVESWSEGVDIFHNPSCQKPLPRGLFTGLEVQRFDADQSTGPMSHPFIPKSLELPRMRLHGPGWHPFMSKTFVSSKVGGPHPLVTNGAYAVDTTTEEEFEWSFAKPIEFDEEITDGWYLDNRERLWGLLTIDSSGRRWKFRIFLRDEDEVPHCIEASRDYKFRNEARTDLQIRMFKITMLFEFNYSKGIDFPKAILERIRAGEFDPSS